MDIHKPKPFHGAREFLGEVGIIVIGVLIALLAEQAASKLHWLHEVEQTHRALAVELGAIKGESVERVRAYGCVQKRLDQLAALIDRAARTGRLEPLGDIGAPPSRPWSHAVWDSAVQNAVTAHIAREERLHLSQTYTNVADLGIEGDHEIELWSRLYGLVGPGSTVDAGTVAADRSLISQARFANRFMSLVSAQTLERLAASNTAPVDQAHAKDALEEPLSAFSVCHPVGPAPTSYGGAPWTYAEPAIADGLRYAQYGLR